MSLLIHGLVIRWAAVLPERCGGGGNGVNLGSWRVGWGGREAVISARHKVIS